MRGRRSPLTILLVAFALALFVVQPLRAINDIRDTDYVTFVGGAHLLESGNCLYCLDTNRAERSRLLGVASQSGTDNPFVTPPASAALFIPFAALPLKAGLELYLVLALLAMAAAAWLLWRSSLRGRSDWALLLACALGTLPATEAFANAQWAPFLLLAVAAALVLGRRHPVVAGVLLAFALVKPQLIWLLPAVLLLTGQWRMLGGFVAGGIAWLAAGIAVAGTAGLHDWIAAATARRGVTQVQNGGVPGLVTAIGLPAPAAVFVMAALGAVALAVVWRHRDRLAADPALAIALGAGLSLASVAYVWPYDLALLAPMVVMAGLLRPMAAVGAALLLDIGHVCDLTLPAAADHAVPIALLIVTALSVATLVTSPPARASQTTA